MILARLAPKTSLLSIALLLSAAALPARAQTVDDVLRCLDITEDAARHACLDTKARALKAASVASAATAAASASAAREDRFGKSAPAPAPAATAPEEISSRIAGRFSGWDKGQRVTLANGQVWQLTDDGTVFAPLQDPAVTIRGGLMKSAYFASVEGLPFQIRVKRIR